MKIIRAWCGNGYVGCGDEDVFSSMMMIQV